MTDSASKRDAPVDAGVRTWKHTASCISFIVTLTACHRLLLWHALGRDIDAVALANRDWITWQYFGLPAYKGYLQEVLIYLQQTPPLPHLIFGLLAKAAQWPLGVARSLYVLQAIITTATAAVMYLVIVELRIHSLIALGVSLWFALSADLYVMELNSLGQLFYESGAMLFGIATCYLLIGAMRRVRERRSATLLCLGAGVAIALCALTRASF